MEFGNTSLNYSKSLITLFGCQVGTDGAQLYLWPGTWDVTRYSWCHWLHLTSLPVHKGVFRLDFVWWWYFIENGILLSILFWPTVRKNWSSDREKLLKFESEGQEFEFANFLRSLEQFIQTVKGQKNFW